MVLVQPITTCEFIPMLRMCKPPTGWPRKLGMDSIRSVSDDADNGPSQLLPTLADQILRVFRSY